MPRKEGKNVIFCAEALHKKLLSLIDSKKIYCLNLLQAFAENKSRRNEFTFPSKCTESIIDESGIFGMAEVVPKTNYSIRS